MNSDGASTKQTLIEEGTTLKGTLTSECPVLVRGRVEGEIEAPVLAISTGGSVQGKVKAGAVSSEGELSGEVDADSVKLSGTVKDTTVIRAKTLEVKLTGEGRTQAMFGECELDIGDAPVDEKLGRAKKKGKKGEDVAEGEAAPGGGDSTLI